MAVLGLRFSARAFSNCGKRGPLFIAVHQPLTVAASRCGAQAPDAQAQLLWLTGLVAPRHVGSSRTRARTHVPCIGRQTLNHCATREARGAILVLGLSMGPAETFLHLQPQAPPIQSAFCLSLLLQVSDQHCSLKHLPAYSCSLSPPSITGVSP